MTLSVSSANNLRKGDDLMYWKMNWKDLRRGEINLVHDTDFYKLIKE
ncbi:MAG: hypothetical protein MJZ20_13445 [Bacteroidaceae bacterium]|nr:hypothetical protein [Bacteroidaceae bacterium]